MRQGSSKTVCYLWRWSCTWDWTQEDSLWRLLGNGCWLWVLLCFGIEMEQLGQSERVEEPLETLWLHHWFSASAL